MIIENSHNVNTNLHNSMDFGIVDDAARIFSFLGQHLYSEKERSVITELSSNAIDAHIMVGKGHEPFHVTLPTSLDPVFTVRDFGPGLCESDIYKFLTKYGSSSKGATNDFIGGFGIGSKSPAAVTDSWNIISYNDGIETEYLIHINEKGIPRINKLYSKPTTETGLKVVIPTKSANNWYEAAKSAYAHYEVLPVLKGGNASSITNVKYTFEYKNLYKFSSRIGYQSAKGYILMNRRSYDLDYSKVTGFTSPFDSDFNWYLPFTTSDLSVSLSREQLQYDSSTVEKIKNRIGEILESLKAEWKIDVTPHTSAYEYQIAADTFRNKYRINSTFCRTISNQNGDKFCTLVNFDNLNSFSIELPKTDPKLTVESYISYATVDVVKAIKQNRYGVGIHYVSLKTDYNNGRALKFNSMKKDDIAFILKDVPNTPSRVKNAIANKVIPACVILEKDLYDSIPDSFLKVKASDLDKVVIKREKREVIKSATYRLDGKRLEKYIITDTNIEWVGVKFTNANTIDSIVGDFDKKFVAKFRNTFGVNIIAVKDDGNFPANTITPLQWVTNKYNELILKKSDIIDALNLQTYNSVSTYYIYGFMLKKPALFKDFPNTTVISKIMEEIREFSIKKINLNNVQLCDTLATCEELLGKPSANIAYSSNFEGRIQTAYPMMKLLHNRYANDLEVEEVVKYMKLCGV
jgi:hypothetical protein